jgi:hypothetical protein
MNHVNMVPKHGDTPVGHSVCSSYHTSKFMYRASHLVWPKLLYIEQDTVDGGGDHFVLFPILRVRG